ncbi:MAG: hypothetical protein EOP45_01540 [Sphingobacteriaceae bacterium]|nr:MAG: hypothetical protein EOP45_01540 [Sphingobacteriaceae bacterium]
MVLSKYQTLIRVIIMLMVQLAIDRTSISPEFSQVHQGSKILIKPSVGGKLTSAEASDNSKFKLTVIIPPDTTAEVYVPNAKGSTYIKIFGNKRKI